VAENKSMSHQRKLVIHDFRCGDLAFGDRRSGEAEKACGS
jgi:hypothetical protein